MKHQKTTKIANNTKQEIVYRSTKKQQIFLVLNRKLREKKNGKNY